MCVIEAPRVEDTEAAAAALGRLVRAGDVIALVGDLGAGKTTFVKGLAVGMGFAALVTSPTFTLVHIYEGARAVLFHVDLYRLDDDSQLLDVGLDDLYRQEGVVAVEWFDRFPRAAPRDYLEVRLSVGADGTRTLAPAPHGARAAALAEAWEAAVSASTGR